VKTIEPAPLQGVSCCRAVADYHPPTQAATGAGDLHPGDILDNRFLITELISRSGMAMIFKAVGLKPNGRLESTAARIAWWTMRLRAFALEQGGLIPPRGYRTEKARIPPTGRDRAIA